MNGLNDYVKYYGSYTFDEEPFNEVDNLVFSIISYIDFEGIIPTTSNEFIELGEAARRFFDKYTEKDSKLNIVSIRKAIYLLKNLENTKRYRNVIVSNYKYSSGTEEQFGALSFRYNKLLYVAFEGTDNLLSGWEEDFKLAYKFPTTSQQKAIDYLNSSVKFSDKVVYVGGHSKGGNLAVVSSIYCSNKIKRKIKTVYNNDGPGLREEVIKSQKYLKVKDKIKTFIPEHSVVGLLLNHTDDYTVVASTSTGILEHEGTTWCCFGSHFVKSRLSKSSQRFDDIINKYINNYDDLQMERFTHALFDIFRKAEISDLREIKSSTFKSIGKIMASTKDIDQEVRDMLIDMFKAFMQ